MPSLSSQVSEARERERLKNMTEDEQQALTFCLLLMLIACCALPSLSLQVSEARERERLKNMTEDERREWERLNPKV